MANDTPKTDAPQPETQAYKPCAPCRGTGLAGREHCASCEGTGLEEGKRAQRNKILTTEARADQ